MKLYLARVELRFRHYLGGPRDDGRSYQSFSIPTHELRLVWAEDAAQARAKVIAALAVNDSDRTFVDVVGVGLSETIGENTP